METTFKSNTFKLFTSFIGSAVVTNCLGLLLAYALTMAIPTLPPDFLVQALPFTATVAVLLSVYLAFFHWRITVEVTADEIIFSRMNKPYLRFSFSENTFSSSVHTMVHYYLIRTTNFSLRVMPQGEENFKDYRLHNFDELTFNNFIARVNANSFKENIQQVDSPAQGNSQEITKGEALAQAVASLDTEPMVFTIKRDEFIRQTKNMLLGGAALGVVVVSIVTAIAVVGRLNMLVAAVLPVACSIAAYKLGYLPFKFAQECAPEKITVYNNRITIDEQTFMYDNITSLQMTTPNTYGDRVLLRTLVITAFGEENVFVLGADTDKHRRNKSPIFARYGELVDVLGTVFALRVSGDEVSVFTVK
ncbi:MAG: hypothetical protein FWG87_10620 [Defluviitaleaceae bacterium]|nr:hypothetical protein [Defluviitaleaceae bacterium]